MQKIILLGHSGYETFNNLSNTAQEIAYDCNVEFIPRTKLKNNDLNDAKNTILIRWGTTQDGEYDHVFGMTLNTSHAISLNTNKLKTLEIFKNNNVLCPAFFKNKQDITCFPVLGRDNHHHGGKDVVIINGSNLSPIWKNNNINNIPNKNFYTQFIKSSKEYRVHVFNGNIIRTTQKVFRGTTREGKIVDKPGIIRNDTYGWGHKNVQYIETAAQQVSINAVKSLGLNFGAVDLIYGTDNRYYVLEVNTAPHLNDVGLDIYLEQILSLKLKSKIIGDIKKKLNFWS
jgi:glutathione synthase/RimK-type ligase-like ATP-grasp enzyme